MANRIPIVASIQVHENWILSLNFADGKQNTIDMKPYLDFGVFQALKDPALFAQARISFGTVEWPGGIDLDPEWLAAQPLSDRLQVAEPEAPYGNEPK